MTWKAEMDLALIGRLRLQSPLDDGAELATATVSTKHAAHELFERNRIVMR